MKDNDKKNIIWNSIGSLLSAISSLVFLIIVTRINGVEQAGIFTYCFATACLFYTISIYSTRSFQVTDTNKKNSDSDYLYNRITTCVLMIIVALLFSILRNYNLYKSIVLVLLCIYKCIETLEETIYAVIQKNNQLDKVGKSMTIRSLLIYSIFLIVDLLTNSVTISIISILLANIFIIFFFDLNILKKIEFKNSKFNIKKNYELLKLGFTTFAFSFLSIYLLNSSRYAIDSNLSEEFQTIFGIIVMPGMVMSLLSQFIIQPFLVKVTSYIKKNKYEELEKMNNKLLLIMIGIGLLIILMAALVGIPILEIIYGIKLKNYYIEFLLIMLGALFYGLSIIISQILIALRKNLSQLLTLGVLSIIAIFSSSYLVINYQVSGASYNYLIIMLLEFICYMLMLKYYTKKLKNDGSNI